MQGFETKKALLEYLGKDPNDRKLVDRMLSRGEVHMEDGMYYLVNKDAIIKELEARIFFLENEQGKNTTVQVKDANLEKELMDAKNDLTFQISEYERLQHKMEKSLRKCYDFMLGKKLFTEERNPFSSFVKWAEDVSMDDVDEEVPF